MSSGGTSPAASGGTQAVGCLLARDAGLNIRTAGSHPILWDALYDNVANGNPLAAIPTGLGLSFVFNGTSANITATADGFWSFSTWLFRPDVPSIDPTWEGQFDLAGRRVQWPGTTNESRMIVTEVLGVPSGTVMAPLITVSNQATANPYEASASMAIVRIG